MLIKNRISLKLITCSECNCILSKNIICNLCKLPFHNNCFNSHSCRPDITKIQLNPLNYIRYLKKHLPFPKIQYKSNLASPNKCVCCDNSSSYFYRKNYCLKCFNSVVKNNFCKECGIVFDPNNYDVDMILCDFCTNWVHYECANLDSESIKEYDCKDFMCNRCKESKKHFLINSDTKKCLYCKKGGNDFHIYLISIGNNYQHIFCKNLNGTCIICQRNDPTVKCKRCSDLFHLKCAEGLFRWDLQIPQCSNHFKPLNFKRVVLKFIRKKLYKYVKENESCLKKYVFFKGVFYSKKFYVRIFFGKKNDTLKFNGKYFFWNDKKIEISELSNIGIDVKNKDVFNINSKEFAIYRKMFRKVSDKVLRRLCRIFNGSKYIF